MKITSSFRLRFTFVALLSSLLPLISAFAQVDGSWISTAGGTYLWEDETNWSSDPQVPGGIGSVVRMENDILSTVTINLGSTSQTVGDLFLGDASGTSPFFISSSEGGALIFDQSGGASLNFNQGGGNTISAPIVLDSDLTIANNVGASQQLNGAISGTGSITHTAGRVVYVNFSPNTFSGGYKLDGGTTAILAASNLGTGTLTLSSGTFEAASGGGITINNNVKLDGNVTREGTSTTLDFSGSVTLTANSTITAEGSGSTNILGNISGNYNLIKTGSQLMLLSGNNTHTGYTEVQQGILRIRNDAIADTSDVRITGGELQLFVNNQTVNSVLMSSGKISVLAGPTTLTASAFNFTNSGEVEVSLAGTGSTLTKTGGGVVALNWASGSSYTGGTLVNAGTLLVNNVSGSGTGTGTVTVASGAILGGDGILSGATTISGSLRPGNSMGTLTIANDVTWNAGDAWVFELGVAADSLALADSGSSTQDLLVLTGAGSDFFKGSGSDFTFDFAGGGEAGWYKLVDWTGTTNFSEMDFLAMNLGSGLSGAFVIDHTTSALYLNVIPEPSTLVLLISTMGAAALFRRRR